MSGLELRPRFKWHVNLEQPALVERFSKYLKNNNNGCGEEMVGQHLTLCVPAEEHHYWSPQLSLEIIAEGERSLLKGHFGPRPAVWTMFMFFYMGIGFSGLIGLFWGLSQWSLKQPAWALWIVPVAILLELVFYLIAQGGKRLAHSQMVQLQNQLTEIIGREYIETWKEKDA
ncbi:MAG TPA: hypothetical protein ENJ10_05815 [Caldithrix abyssi]|uniref:Uncharacterized protein n=1 Tax=Caldithrix abyssi TaxID=187145 RepID=A0A7V1PTZ9_CALAY|nr:hypothetical protein [Caldithrix abyssi]